MAEQSRVHRIEVGDKVAFTTEGHDNISIQDEGVVKAFANDEMTYLEVVFGEGDEEKVYVVTEDELRRLA